MNNFIKKHSHILSIICPIFAGALFLIFCSLNMNSAIWFDESYTSLLVRGDFSEIWDLTSIDVHPPLFYFSLKIWTMIFGHSVVAMRYMSVFFGLIAIVFAFHLVKRHFGTKPAIFAAIFMAFSPMFVRYGQEMRMYTMVTAIVFAATYFLSIALEKQQQNPKSARKFWIVYALLICAGMWTHYFCALAWLAHVVYIIYYFKLTPKTFWKDKPLRFNLILTYALAVLLYIPWLYSFFFQIKSVENGFWIQDVTAKTILDFVTESFAFTTTEHTSHWIVPILFFAVISIIVYSVLTITSAKSSSRKKYLLLLSIMFLPPLFLIILSMPPLRPLFVDRYVIYSATALWIFIGLIFATAKVKRKIPYILTIFATLTLSISGIINVKNREPDSHVYYTLQTVAAMSTDGEPILMHSDWDYYDAAAYTSDAKPIYFYSNWSNYQYSSLEPIRRYNINVFSSIDDFKKDHDTFWVIVGAEEEVPEEFSDYKVLYTVANDHHNAYELQQPSTKNSK